MVLVCAYTDYDISLRILDTWLRREKKKCQRVCADRQRIDRSLEVVIVLCILVMTYPCRYMLVWWP